MPVGGSVLQVQVSRELVQAGGDWLERKSAILKLCMRNLSYV